MHRGERFFNVYQTDPAKRLSQKIGCGEKISAADFEEESTTSGTLRLDGVEIEGATRKSRYKNETEDQEEDTMANNDYILAKLFKNSKVHSVSGYSLLHFNVIFEVPTAG